MNKKISTTFLALALISTGALAATVAPNYQDKVNATDQGMTQIVDPLTESEGPGPYAKFADTLPEANRHQAMIDQLLPKLLAPLADEDKSSPYDATKDCLLVSTYDTSPAAPACQIVLQSGDYLPVKRGHSRFFIDTPDGQLGPFATGNLMGAPVAQPYTRLIDHHEVKHAQVHENR